MRITVTHDVVGHEGEHDIVLTRIAGRLGGSLVAADSVWRESYSKITFSFPGEAQGNVFEAWVLDLKESLRVREITKEP